MFIHVLFYFPETKGKRLEEVAQMWDEHVPAWKSASWKPAVPIATDKILEKKLSVQHVEDNDNSTEDDHSMSNSEKAVQIA